MNDSTSSDSENDCDGKKAAELAEAAWAAAEAAKGAEPAGHSQNEAEARWIADGEGENPR